MANKEEGAASETDGPPLSHAKLESRFARLRQAAQEREATEVIQLPLWPEAKRGHAQ